MTEASLVTLAIRILTPLLGELVDYLAGRTKTPPAFLINVPAHLQSEAALVRKLYKKTS